MEKNTCRMCGKEIEEGKLHCEPCKEEIIIGQFEDEVSAREVL